MNIGASTMFGIGFVVDFYQSKNEGDTKNVYSQNKSVQLSNLLKLIKTNNKEY